MKEDSNKAIANTSAYPYHSSRSSLIRRPIVLNHTRRRNLFNPSPSVVQYMDANSSTSNLFSTNFSNEIPIRFSFPLEGIPQPNLPFVTQPYQSFGFFLPMTNFQRYPIQPMADLSHSSMLQLEQGVKPASKTIPGSYVCDQCWQLDSSNTSMLPKQIYATTSRPERETLGSVEASSLMNNKSLAKSDSSNKMRKAKDHINSPLYNPKKLGICGGADEIMLNNNHAPNLIVTLNLKKDQVTEKNFIGSNLNANSISRSLEKQIIGKAAKKRRRITRCSQRERMAYKNQHVEPFRYRNVYKFILKNLHNYVKDESILIGKEMIDEKFSIDSISGAFKHIQGLVTKESPNDSFKLSRSKLDILLNNPSTAFVLKQSLISTLQKLMNDEFPQILEKNKGTYKEACEVYLKKGEEKVDAWKKTLASNN